MKVTEDVSSRPINNSVLVIGDKIINRELISASGYNFQIECDSSDITLLT